MSDPTDDADLARQLAVLTAGAEAVLPGGGLAVKLLTARREGRPLRVKLGIDPSADELTLGNAVVLRKLRQFQDLGHTAVLIVGDFTGRVGDPTGKSLVRKQLSAEQTAANSATYLQQLMLILDPERVEVRRNSEWLGTMGFDDVIREASTLTVAQLLERDDFAQRFSSHTPISLSELLYPLLQGYDSVAIRADVELGGTDQTHNNLVGRDLQRAHGQSPQVVLTVPLLEGLDGVAKMSKSLDNYVGISAPPAEQFGKLMSIPDEMVGRYAELAAWLEPAEVTALAAAAAAGGPAASKAKRVMAHAVVTLYHGAGAAARAESAFDAQFTRREVPADAPYADLPPGDPVHLPALLRALGLAGSTSDGRRLIDGGSVRIDGTRVDPGTLDLPRAVLAGHTMQVGRRRVVALRG